MGLKLFIDRPVLAIALCLLILLLGISAYLTLPVRHFPLLPASKVTVMTVYPGASPDVMEGFISIPMQQALSGLENVDYISSQNMQNQSLITIKFFIGTNIDARLPEISNRIAGIRWKLPKNINSPIITKINPNTAATGAILYVDANSKILSDEEMTDYLKRVVAPQFEGIKGVKEVQIFGAKEYAMRIWLNPKKMAALHITAPEVIAALKTHNLRSTSGNLNSPYLKFIVNTSTNLATAKEYNNIVITQNHGRYIRIRDIGEAVLGSTDYTSNAYANGKKTVMMGVTTTDNANSIVTAFRVLRHMRGMKHALPPGMHLELVWDVTQFSRQAIKEVKLTIIEATVFVFIVIFLFLGSLRTIIVPLLTIPLSLLGAAALMKAFDYSLNSLTFLAWVLAIGLVVDDAIVIVENVHRHIQLKLSRHDAAFKGVYELRHAIVTITLAVAIVFAPIGFVPGLSGALFKEFAFTLSLVVLVSGMLALYVSPVMCTRFLPNTHGPKSLPARIDRVFNHIRHGYMYILRHMINMWWLVILAFAALILMGVGLIHIIPSELAPHENVGVLVGIGVGPSDANLDYMNKYSVAFNKLYQELPEHQAYGLFNSIPLFGANYANSWVLLKPKYITKQDETRLQVKLENETKRIPGLLAFVLKPPPIPGALPGESLSFILKTSDSYDKLAQQIIRLKNAANNYPGIEDPTTTFKLDKTQINVNINRDKAAALGVPIAEISETLATMLGQPIVGFFDTSGYSYEIIPQVYRRFRLNPEDINYMYVRAKNGMLVPLLNLVTIKETVAPESYDQFQQMRSATLKMNLAPHYTMGEALNFLENFVKTKMPHNYSYDFIGQSRQYQQSRGVLIIAFSFAIALIYLLLAAHFNSLRDPFIVMLSVPLAMAGALYMMFLSGATLNIYTKIGLIMLVGLISKHGILIVDFANLQQKQGKNRLEAVIEGASIRLRPILMTTAAMVCGALPLVLAHGAGAIARQQIGWVVIGGMSLGTCLTLFVVPTAYAFFAKKETPEPSSTETASE